MINDHQYQQLLKPLNPSRVAKRQQAGRNLSYLEAWDVKAHLIRIFGFGGWSWDVLSADIAFEEKNEKGQWNVGYKVVGRLRIESLCCTYTEAAIGSSSLPQRGEAHDMAIKTAESDALKRAAINLGTQFGLSLYDNGSLKDVVGTTLDKGDPPKEQPSQEEDNADTGIWIEQMKALLDERDIQALITLQSEMRDAGVLTHAYQGQTLAKWLDKAIAKAGSNA